jgi:hypothetical protein
MYHSTALSNLNNKFTNAINQPSNPGEISIDELKPSKIIISNNNVEVQNR